MSSNDAKPFTLVVGSDFSEASGFAFHQGARIAGRIPGSELHVVHVIEGEASGEQTKQHADRLHAELEERVRALCGHERQVVGVHVRCGRPARELAQFGKEVGADLLVVGARKGPHRKQLVLGAVAERLLLAAPCPVLVAGPIPEADFNAHDPAIESPCPACVQARRASAGREWWCPRHSQHHAAAHSYSYQRELLLRTHDSAVLPTGVD